MKYDDNLPRNINPREITRNLNQVWAFAKLLLDDRGHRGHVGHVATLAAAAQRRAAEMNPQGVANSLWTLRTIGDSWDTLW